uniref:Cytochrome c oxidase subunit 3 n=1 Tax=Diddensiella santjacobensis TaxID=2704139 RepID=S5U4V4_9ASCO|nr:cytochrome c oxidase subunit 3 [Diddensiella santjacobensis]AGS44131.1 cytochrome c oxidase subunit 3 [Diddensiella santjacobensis]
MKNIRYLRALSQLQAHPNHLVTPSPWPIFAAFSVGGVLFSIVMCSHNYIGNSNIIFVNILCLAYSMSLWGRDIISEATFLGFHTKKVRRGLHIGYLLFIVSEAMFFLGLFWAYFHSSLSPNIEIGAMWPPLSITAIGPLELPLLNTIILLSSGATITYSHHALISGNYYGSFYSLAITVLLAIIFTICQYFEYRYATYTIADSVYGSCFYSLTGLHMWHIVTGTIFLSLSLWRIYIYHYTSQHHVGYETTILLWHFLDVVWLLLYVVLYWWGT